MTQLAFEHVPIFENDEPLIDASKYPFVIEPVYFNQGISDDPILWLRKGVLDKLLEVQENLKSGYGFKLWDGYRSREVQSQIYDSFRSKLSSDNPGWSDEKLDSETQRFVTRATDPKRVPPHATGGTIDLTLVDSAGVELNMGTGFDHFGPEATPLYLEADAAHQDVHQNRMILREALLSAGFGADDDEWWHFDYGNQAWAVRTGHQQAIYGEAAH